jgi:type I restriction enzyme, S subunit
MRRCVPIPCIRGQTRPGINGPILKLAPVALPPRTEQEAIVEAVEDQLSIIDHLEAGIDTKLESATSLRYAILRRAFTGQLLPQDPNDEPASELLKRIATEREARSREAATAKRAANKTNGAWRRRPMKQKEEVR